MSLQSGLERISSSLTCCFFPHFVHASNAHTFLKAPIQPIPNSKLDDVGVKSCNIVINPFIYLFLWIKRAHFRPASSSALERTCLHVKVTSRTRRAAFSWLISLCLFTAKAFRFNFPSLLHRHLDPLGPDSTSLRELQRLQCTAFWHRSSRRKGSELSRHYKCHLLYEANCSNEQRAYFPHSQDFCCYCAGWPIREPTHSLCLCVCVCVFQQADSTNNIPRPGSQRIILHRGTQNNPNQRYTQLCNFANAS